MNDLPLKSTPSSKRRPIARALLGLKLVVSFGLLFLLFRRIDFSSFLQGFADMRVKWLISGLVLLQGQALISTLKWKGILKSDGHRVPFLFLWKTYLIGGFLSLFLPTSFGGDVYRVWALNRRGIHIGKSTASVLFDRLSGLFALATVGVIGMLALPGTQFEHVIIPLYLLAVGGVVVCTSDAVLDRLPQPRQKLLALPFRVMRSFNLYRRSPRTMASTLALSGLFQFNIVLVVFCYVRALNVPPLQVTFTELMAAVPVVYLTEMLPISINGIGVRDSAFVFFFNEVGGTTEQALAVSLLVIVVRYLSGMIGGVLLLIGVLRGERLRNAAVALSTTSNDVP